ncbi:glycosyl hydrolase family 28-related protein [Paenibacillus typhae]|uniref:Pectate lyase superfamily protein n=1 Tax=Paenibacillus typhae TaxID=1174501 RepID=A0A1G8G8U3_9BACL|nr:glycosyl hydrolase family 28-related protein [Paenibacillus typhae]SDH90809.1 Pectate lyase superfamily protein [Paenibacillus typhae]
MNDTFDVKRYGAAGDGVTVDTRAIQQAIDECHGSGGGTVVLSGGTFVSGTIFLKSNVNLQLSPSALLLASPDIRDFAEDVVNVSISGQGEINGNAEKFPNEGSIYRPMMMRFLRCRNIHVTGMRLYNSTAWTILAPAAYKSRCRLLTRRSIDMRLEHPEAVAENYYPDWSRANFMDIQNVERLTVDVIRFHALRGIRGNYI